MLRRRAPTKTRPRRTGCRPCGRRRHLSQPVYLRLVWKRQCLLSVEWRVLELLLWPTLGAAGGVPGTGPGSISRGLRASGVACGHRASDVGQRQTGSAKACTHRRSLARIGQSTSGVASPHRPFLAQNGRSTSRVACPHRPSLARIAQSTSGVAWPLRPSLAPIAQSTSAVECPHRPRLALHWSRCRRQHADVLEFPKSKECQTPFMHNNIFIYFPSSILNVSASRGSFAPNFIIFTVYYFLRNVSKIKIY